MKMTGYIVDLRINIFRRRLNREETALLQSYGSTYLLELKKEGSLSSIYSIFVTLNALLEFLTELLTFLARYRYRDQIRNDFS